MKELMMQDDYSGDTLEVGVVGTSLILDVYDKYLDARAVVSLDKGQTQALHQYLTEALYAMEGT